MSWEGPVTTRSGPMQATLRFGKALKSVGGEFDSQVERIALGRATDRHDVPEPFQTVARRYLGRAFPEGFQAVASPASPDCGAGGCVADRDLEAAPDGTIRQDQA